MTYRLGVDTGGTFTDFILVDEDDGSYRIHKTPSTPENPAGSLATGISELANALGEVPREFAGRITVIVHGTTVATNAVLTGEGAKTALVTTAGFRDALQMRRGMREETLNNKLEPPVPLVPRHLRFGIAERVTFSGDEESPLDHQALIQAGRRCRDEGVEALAICFLHAYANPEHERQARKVVESELPDVFVTTSHELLAQIRLYERVSSTVLNAYTGPLIEGYLRALVASLEDLGFEGDLLIMQSNGGLSSPAIARDRSAATLLSGPAGAPVAGAVYSEAVGARNCLTIDMGGTSFDAALVPDGRPTMLPHGGWINRHRVALPMLAIHTIGAGGGSIGSIDASGILRMGPKSAGAAPGPACYGQGGRLPTCTDANLVLGYLNPDNFLAGKIRLDAKAAGEAIRAEVGERMGVTVPQAAAAMFQVINVNMTEGIREVSVDQGEDPRDFLLVVGGGAGGIHAGVIADELGIPELLIPRDSSVFAAAGMLLADVRHDAVRAIPARFAEVDPGLFVGVMDELVEQVSARIEHDGFRQRDVTLEPACDLRYAGQFHEITLQLAPETARTGDLDAISAGFHSEHERLYGWATPGADLELVNVRVSARAARPRPSRRSVPGGSVEAASTGKRAAYLPFEQTFEQVPIFAGEKLGRGCQIAGPAIIELPTTTVLVPEIYKVAVTEHGDFSMTRRLDDAS